MTEETEDIDGVTKAVRCRNCKFFVPSRDSAIDGRCRRYPPHYIGRFPAIAGYAWCGEFLERPAQQEINNGDGKSED